jgi:DNA-binding beta-propeller fold protein YncE
VGGRDGTPGTASFNGLQGIAADAAGNLYVTDAGSNKIRMVTPSGVVSTLAGGGTANGSSSGFSNGTGVSALFSDPRGIAIDPSGTALYVTDFGNNAIRKITITPGQATNGVVSTLANLNGPWGIASDGNDNLYVTEFTGRRISKIVISSG